MRPAYIDLAEIDTDSLARLVQDAVDELRNRNIRSGDRAEPTHGDTGMTAMTPAHPEPRFPHLGSDVIYRSRTGDYSLAAKVARNAKSSSPEALHRGVEAGRLFMVPLTLLEVDLTVFTPGGSYVEGEPSQWTGTYAEHAIKYDANGERGTWCWFDDLVRRGVEL